MAEKEGGKGNTSNLEKPCRGRADQGNVNGEGLRGCGHPLIVCIAAKSESIGEGGMGTWNLELTLEEFRWLLDLVEKSTAKVADPLAEVIHAKLAGIMLEKLGV